MAEMGFRKGLLGLWWEVRGSGEERKGEWRKVGVGLGEFRAKESMVEG